MRRTNAAVRAFAGGIALTAWAGLLLQGWVTYGIVGTVARTLEAVLRYFTITTALLSAIVFTAIAAGVQRAAAAPVVAGVGLAEMLVGVVYGLLLHGLLELSGGSAVANAVLHYAAPVLVPVFWAVCTPKGGLRWPHPLIWAIYPLAYLAVAIASGRWTGRYPYPFSGCWKARLDASDGELGWDRGGVFVDGVRLSWAGQMFSRKERCLPLMRAVGTEESKERLGPSRLQATGSRYSCVPNVAKAGVCSPGT